MWHNTGPDEYDGWHTFASISRTPRCYSLCGARLTTLSEPKTGKGLERSVEFAFSLTQQSTIPHLEY